MAEAAPFDAQQNWTTLTRHAQAAGKSGDMAGVTALFRERAASGNLAPGDPKSIGTIVHRLAVFCQQQGNLKDACEGYEESARYFLEAGDKSLVQAALAGQAAALIELGDYQRAMPVVAERARICRDIHHRQGLMDSLTSQAKLLHWAGDTEHAAEVTEELEALAHELGGDAEGIGLMNRALSLMAERRMDEAGPLFEESERVLRRGTDRRALANVLGSRGMFLFQKGDLAAALALQSEAAGIARGIGDVEGLAKNLAMQAVVLHQLGRTAEARPLAEEADRVARSKGLTAMAAEMIAPILQMVGGTSTAAANGDAASAPALSASVPAQPTSASSASHGPSQAEMAAAAGELLAADAERRTGQKFRVVSDEEASRALGLNRTLSANAMGHLLELRAKFKPMLESGLHVQAAQTLRQAIEAIKTQNLGADALASAEQMLEEVESALELERRALGLTGRPAPDAAETRKTLSERRDTVMLLIQNGYFKDAMNRAVDAHALGTGAGESGQAELMFRPIFTALDRKAPGRAPAVAAGAPDVDAATASKIRNLVEFAIKMGEAAEAGRERSKKLQAWQKLPFFKRLFTRKP